MRFQAPAPGEPFGRRLVRKRGDTGIYFVPKWLHEYQHPDMFEAVAKARAAAGGRRIVTYGSSMGAIGASAYAKELYANLVIALAPICSLHPDLVGHFDQRFTGIHDTLSYVRRDCRDGLTPLIKTALIYDPLAREDRINAEMMAEAGSPRLIQIPGGGHAVAHALLRAGLLRSLVEAIADGETKVEAEVLRAYRRARRSTWDRSFSLGERAAAKGKHALAAACFERALGMSSEHVVWRDLAKSLWAQGKRDESIAADRRAMEEDPAVGAHWASLGEKLFLAGRESEALVHFRQAVKALPDCGFCWNGLSFTLRATGDRDGSIAAIRRALELEPQMDPWRAELDAMVAAEREAAIAEGRRALEQEPGEGGHWANLGERLVLAGRLDEALALFRQAVEALPDCGHCWNGLSFTLRALGDREGSIAAIRRALELEPGMEPWRAELDAMLTLEREDAIAVGRRALALDPTSGGHWANLGEQLVLAGRPDEGLALFREAVEALPDCGHCWNGLSFTLRALGDREGSIAAIRRALELEPQMDPWRAELDAMTRQAA